jgi:hypothetical protein
MRGSQSACCLHLIKQAAIIIRRQINGKYRKCLLKEKVWGVKVYSVYKVYRVQNPLFPSIRCILYILYIPYIPP